MKCPFRPTTIRVEAANTCREETIFEDCYGAECPYYGKMERRHRNAGGFETVVVPCCRRCEDD